MSDSERAHEIVFSALRTMKVDVSAVDPRESVLRVLDAARPSHSVFKLDLMRGRLLRKIVDAAIVQREMGPDDREGYEIDSLIPCARGRSRGAGTLFLNKNNKHIQ